MSEPTPRVVLVAGATGFIGGRLVPELLEAGFEVRAMTRHPEDYSGPGTAVYGDVGDPGSLAEPLTGVDVAVYLVHSLDSEDFERKDAAAAEAFATAAAATGVEQIVYLGGLGPEDEQDLSPHLRSRREVERILQASGVPVTVLRAAIVVGHGSVSWEITRQLVDHLPAMVVPKWAATRTQPIAIQDVVRYLVAVVDHPDARGATYEIGGPDVLTYVEMLEQAAKVAHGRDLRIAQVPVLTPRLSSHWMSLVTDVDTTTAANLIDSMGTEVVVHEHGIRALSPADPLPYADAVRIALAERRRDRRDTGG